MTHTRKRRYNTIVIDPPWPGPTATPYFDRRGTQMVIPYATMTGVQIGALGVDGLSTDTAQLFIWATNRSLGDAYLLLQGWNFNWRGTFIWAKMLGMGRHVRSQAEFLIWAARPGAKLVTPKECPPQIHHWPKPKRHSAKPDEAYTFIRSLSEAPRLDIFARQKRYGFEPWGNQVPEAKAA